MRQLLRPIAARRPVALLALALTVLLVVAAEAFAANIQGDGTLVGTTGNDNINAGNGNDTIWGLGGQDSINAGNGNDTIYGGGGHNSINVGSGNDTIYGGPVGDAINVGGRNTGTDFIYLGAGGGNSVNTGQGTTTVFAQNGHVDTIACHGTTTVYADHTDHTSNCTHVIFTSPSSDHAKKKATKRHAKKAGRKHARRS